MKSSLDLIIIINGSYFAYNTRWKWYIDFDTLFQVIACYVFIKASIVVRSQIIK